MNLPLTIPSGGRDRRCPYAYCAAIDPTRHQQFRLSERSLHPLVRLMLIHYCDHHNQVVKPAGHRRIGLQNRSADLGLLLAAVSRERAQGEDRA